MPTELADLVREAVKRRRAAHVPSFAAQLKPWYRIEARANTPNRAELWIFDVIGSSWFEDSTDAKSFTRDLAALDVQEILLHINSPGGDAFDGLAIYNALVDHKARVTAVVEGVAASAASFVLQAGDVRRVNRAGQMMIHDAAGFAMGNPREMQQALDMLEKVSESIAGIYAARSGTPAGQWRDAMRAETWYTAAEAVDAGLADELVEEKPPEPPVRNTFDLAVFNYAGRAAAPAPPMPSAAARTQTPDPSGPGDTTRRGAVADAAKLREALGLKADASDDEVRNALASAGLASQPAPPADPPQTPPADPPQPGGDPQQPSPAPPVPSPGRPQANSDLIVLDPAQYRQLRQEAARGDEAWRKLREMECDNVLDAAIKAQKFPPSRREHYKARWASDPDGTKQEIDRMQSVPPVGGFGYTGVTDETEQDLLYKQVYPERFAGQGT